MNLCDDLALRVVGLIVLGLVLLGNTAAMVLILRPDLRPWPRREATEPTPDRPRCASRHPHTGERCEYDAGHRPPHGTLYFDGPSWELDDG